MKDSRVTRDGKQKSFFTGKGFYIALAISLVAVGGAAWIGINSTMNQLKNNNDNVNLNPTPSTTAEQDMEWSIPDEQEVAKPQSDVTANEEVQEETSVKEQGFIMPLKGDILNPYSGDKVIKSKTLDEWVMHTGIDIKANVSTPVKAISSGKVVDIRNDDMWGACVVIEHPNGMESHYYNLKTAVNVKKNQNIKLGDVIGSVGETAEIEQADGSHLHFAMKNKGEWIDPMTVCK